MNIGLKGFLATEISVQKHKQPPCTKQILAILHATRNGRLGIVHSCTIYLPQDVMATTRSSHAAVLGSSWSKRGDSASKQDLAQCGTWSHQILHVCLGHGAAWPALSISGFLIHFPSQKPQAHPKETLFTVQIHQNHPKPCNLGWLHLESHLTYLSGDKPTWPSRPVTGLPLPWRFSQVYQPTRISWDLLGLEFDV